jgi:hypothetical protein
MAAAKFTTNKQPSQPKKGEVELTLRACRHYLRKNAAHQSRLIKRIDGAIPEAAAMWDIGNRLLHSE